MNRMEHPKDQQATLRRAGLSMNSELTPDECDRLRIVTEWLEKNPNRDVTEKKLGDMIMHPERRPQSIKRSRQKGQKEEVVMATATATKKKSIPAATVNKIASLRRGGATWDEVIAQTGVKRTSTGFRELLEAAGFDKLGVKKGSKQTSKARAWGSAGNSASSKPAKRVRRKATAKK